MRYSTIEIKEAARIGYSGFLFCISTQGKAEVRSTKASPEYECGKRYPLYPLRATSFVSIIMYLTCTIIVLKKQMVWHLIQLQLKN
jgi:hypothetical protein